MNKRFIRLAIGVVVGLAALPGGIWILTKALADRETLYQGQTIDFWSERLNSTDPSVSNRANAVLNTEIIPQLTDVLFNDTKDFRVKLRLADMVNRLPGVFVMCASADARRSSAAQSLGDCGPPAKAAIPALVKAVQGDDIAVRANAASALGKIHGTPDTVVPLLFKLMDDWQIRAEATEALGGYGSLAKVAVPKLIPLLQVRDKELHRAAVVALKEIDPATAAANGLK
jgi:HEAT repeat protein